MANTFQRFPQVGGDVNIGGNYNEYQLESTLGLITSQLYNDGGALKLKVGMIGIDNGSTKGVSKIDTVTTIDLSGVTNETWAKIEMAVSGTTPVFTALDIAGATDPSEAPAGFKNSYDGEKGGFYISSTKRCIGLAWKNSSGVLLAIINVCPHINNYWASEIGLHTSTINNQRSPKNGIVIEIGDWDMDTDVAKSISHYLYGFIKSIGSISVIVRDDSDNSYYNLVRISSGTSSVSGAIAEIRSATPQVVTLTRVAGDYYDNATFNSTPYNRGWIIIHMRDF